MMSFFCDFFAASSSFSPARESCLYVASQEKPIIPQLIGTGLRESIDVLFESPSSNLSFHQLVASMTWSVVGANDVDATERFCMKTRLWLPVAGTNIVPWSSSVLCRSNVSVLYREIAAA